MAKERVYNFSAGPSMLPLSVLERAASELTCYGDSGMSVMEMSHRSRAYQDIFDATKQSLRDTLSVPENYDILFMQGGATLQFAALPMNLIGRTGKADYVITGNFSGLAAKEARKYGTVHISASTEDSGNNRIPTQEELQLSIDASYLHLCANNTIFGTEWSYVPETGQVPVAADCSSNLLSKPIDVTKYGVIYAGVQKNMAPAGMAVVIIRRDLLGDAMPYTPTLMSYAVMSAKNSMHNTPPTYNIYILGLVLKWIQEQGGLQAMMDLREKRAGLIYDYLDESRLFISSVERDSRSKMNVTFRTGDEALDASFVKEAASRGLVNLKGHRLTGGMRASIYNAMPIEGVEKLVSFMKEFEAHH